MSKVGWKINQLIQSFTIKEFEFVSVYSLDPHSAYVHMWYEEQQTLHTKWTDETLTQSKGSNSSS